MKKNITLLTVFLVQILFSQTFDAELVELNYQGSSRPSNLVKTPQGFYFVADNPLDDDYGRELVFSDGTKHGTYLVKDIRNGVGSSNPEELTLIGNELFFVAYDFPVGKELWKTDGTEVGTVMVKEINPSDFSGPYNLIAFNGILYFNANDGNQGTELWRSDGTESGTYMVKDIRSGPNSSVPSDYFIFNDTLFFLADDGTNGRELWTTDGTAAGTTMFKDINPTSSSINSMKNPLILNNEFYFIARESSSTGYELWKSDGTSAGTVLVKDTVIGSGSIANFLEGAVVGDKIVFKGRQVGNNVELFVSDGTATGTNFLYDVNNNISTSSFETNTNFYVLNDVAYFLANDGTNGLELWMSDGTLSGTSILKDINPSFNSLDIKRFYVDEEDNKMYFFGRLGFQNTNIYVSDGTATGTNVLANLDFTDEDTQNDFIRINNEIIFSGGDSKYGNELFKTDGTTQGTTIFLDIERKSRSSPSRFIEFNGDCIFIARDEEFEYKFFIHDPDTGNTQLLKDIEPAAVASTFFKTIEVGNELYFSARNETDGYELWKTDGTTAGTVMVKDINPGSDDGMYEFQRFYEIDGILYFTASDGVHGFELWRSDGTDAGTYMIKDVLPGSWSSSSFPDQFLKYNNEVYFIGYDDIGGKALYTTDGTDQGTQAVIYLNGLYRLREVNNKLVLIANTVESTYGAHELWLSDGTAAGTFLVEEYGDNINSQISELYKFNNEMYFEAKENTQGYKSIFKTDGTVAGTTLVFNTSTVQESISIDDIDSFITCGDYMYFRVIESNGDEQLWRTDGSVMEQISFNQDDLWSVGSLSCSNDVLFVWTSSPAEIYNVTENSNIANIMDFNIVNGINTPENFLNVSEVKVIDDRLYFRGRQPICGDELYVTTIDFNTLSTTNEYNNNLADSNDIKLYPNPTQDILYFESFQSRTLLSYSIYDVTGRLIELNHDRINQDNSIDVTDLNNALYFIELQFDNGQKAVRKFIKH